ncbi:MAG: DUF4168 domain-containing protein [Alphaproteobacteria bacterium]
MRKVLRSVAVLAAAGAAAWALAPVPTAAADVSLAQSGQEAPPAAQVSEKEAEAFANATIAIEEVSRRWQPDIAGAETPAEQLALRQQAEREMVGEIEKNGLSVNDYNRIFTVAMRDLDVQAKVKQYIRQKRGDLGG